MKPPPFAYHAPKTVDEAVTLLGAHGPEAKVLAGGQSLIPLMKLRLARPAVLVDLGRVSDLDYAREVDGGMAFGALARLSELESADVSRHWPILSTAARQIGHPPIRHRGTVCGSLAHADPAAELPVLALALEAQLRAVGPRGARTIAARDFFVSYFTTSLAPDEILVEARFPRLAPGAGWSFQELARRHGDYALVAAAAVLERDSNGIVRRPRITLGAVADRAIRCTRAGAMLDGAPGGTQAFRAAAVAAAEPLDPPSDVHGSGGYRKRLAQVLVERALAEAWSRAREP